jgi:TorA maturation chaperone TorD
MLDDPEPAARAALADAPDDDSAARAKARRHRRTSSHTLLEHPHRRSEEHAIEYAELNILHACVSVGPWPSSRAYPADLIPARSLEKLHGRPSAKVESA